MDVMKVRYPADYDQLVDHLKNYIACVGSVDTNYFRKRSDPAMAPDTNSFPTNVHNDGLNEKKNSLLYDILTSAPSDVDDIANDYDASAADEVVAMLTDYFSDYDNYSSQPSEPYQHAPMKMTKKDTSNVQRSDATKRYNIDRLKNWLKRGSYRNYMNSYYVRWNLLWPLTEENKEKYRDIK